MNIATDHNGTILEYLTYGDIELAWKRLQHSTRREVKDWLALEIYGHPDLESNYLTTLLRTLQFDNYEPHDAFHFDRPKSDRSLRRFSFLDLNDRLVYQLLCDILISNSYDVLAKLHCAGRLYGNLPNDPVHRSKHVFRPVFGISEPGKLPVSGQYEMFKFRVLTSYDEFSAHEGQPWLVSTDIRSFYPSIDQKHLLSLIKKWGWLPDQPMIDLLQKCLKKWGAADRKGIPIGYECSDYLAHLYINGLDKNLMDFRVHRYVDDIYIFAKDFEQVKDVLFRLDMELGCLGLQRNTAKTTYSRLADYPREKLKNFLSESLSMFAEEHSDPVEEDRRQNALVEIFHQSFDSHSSEDSFDANNLDMRQVAFVHNRLHRTNATIKDVAYYVLDHDLKYAYHALNYLYNNYRNEEFVSKLNSILQAEYEPRALKALALTFLYKMNASSFEHSFGAVINKSDSRDWHLIREVLKVATEAPHSRLTGSLLDRLKNHDNPNVLAYVYWQSFQECSSDVDRCTVIDFLFASEHRILQQLGINFAYRHRLVESVSTTLLEPDMRTFFDISLIHETNEFVRNVLWTFGIHFDDNFPLEKYFGRIPFISQLMRNMYASAERNPTDFVKNAVEFSNSVLSAARDSAPLVDESITQGDHYENGSETLDDVIFDLKNHLDRGYVKVSKQLQLKNDLSRVLGESAEKWHIKEGLRVRNIMFISYSVDDRAWREMLVTAIKSYFGQDPPLWFFEGNLEFSDSIRQEILRNRSITKVAILLTSNNYFASEPVMELEYPYFKQHRDQKNLKILWIPCEPSSADLHGLGDVWTPAGIEPLLGKSENDSKSAIDLAARKLFDYFNPPDSSQN